MLDVFKDGADAWLQRVKSHLIGSIILAFLAINWQPIFFLIFSEAPVLLKFWYFDFNTSFESLFAWPVFYGLVIGLATPFVNLIGSWAARWPTESVRVLNARSSHAVMTAKAEFAIERELASASFKEAALRDAVATQSIEDADLTDTIREKLEAKVEVGPVDDESSSVSEKFAMSDLEKKIFLYIAVHGGVNLDPDTLYKGVLQGDDALKGFYEKFTIERAAVEFRAAIDAITNLGFVESVYNVRGPSGIRLSAKGYRALDRLIEG